jgi:hypothetical protein
VRWARGVAEPRAADRHGLLKRGRPRAEAAMKKTLHGLGHPIPTARWWFQDLPREPYSNPVDSYQRRAVQLGPPSIECSDRIKILSPTSNQTNAGHKKNSLRSAVIDRAELPIKLHLNILKSPHLWCHTV